MVVYGVKLHRSDALQLPDHSDACTEETFVEWCAKQKASGARLAVDLFSGAGGLSLGLEHAGWTVAVAVDFDQRALETHKANFSGLSLKLDLGADEERARLISLLRQVDIDLIAGGPPCQPFSRAGRSKIRSLVDAGARDAKDLRRELWRAYLEIVLAVGPRAVLMENVPDMALSDDFHVVRSIVEKLENDEYHTQIKLADAFKYGVPQHRKRLIVLARRDRDGFAWDEHEKSPVHLEQAIRDLPELESWKREYVGARELAYEGQESPSDFVKLMREDVPEQEAHVVYDHMTRPVREDDYETFQHMTHETIYGQLPEHLRRYRGDTFDDKYKRLHWGDYSRSITAHIAKDGYWYIHPSQHRTLTVREAARIQTFPDHFRFSGTRSDAFKQIGNAVPPLLGEAAARVVAPVLDDDGQVVVERTENTWKSVHQALSAWGERRSRGRSWFAYPSASVGQAVAVVVALVGPARLEAGDLGWALEPIRPRNKIVKQELDQLYESLGNARMVQRLAPIGELTGAQNVWADKDELMKALRMKPAEKAVFRLLMEEDVLLVSQGALRVAARVLDSKSNQKNRLTEGRIDLARLVGGGAEARTRMAAIRQISNAHCLPGEPSCTGCPLRDWCETAKKQPDMGTLY